MGHVEKEGMKAGGELVGGKGVQPEMETDRRGNGKGGRQLNFIIYMYEAIKE